MTFDWKAQGGGASAGYDDFLVPAMFAPLAERMVAKLAVAPGMRILDLACGTGALTRALARAAGPDGEVVGVDLGEPMLAIARAHPAEEGAAPITLLQGDATAIPAGDAAFDLATCQQGLQFFPDRPAALAELRRVLRRGGRLGVACWAAVEQTPFGADAEALTRHMGDEVGSMMHSPFVLGDPEAVGKLLADAGFEDVAARVETIECVFASHTGFARRSIGAGPIDPLFRAAPPAVQQAIEDDVTRALEPFAQPDGTLRAPMPTVIAVGTTPSSS